MPTTAAPARRSASRGRTAPDVAVLAADDTRTGGVSVFLEDVRRGDGAAVGEVARRWLPRVVRIVERKLRGMRAADVEGVAGSVFLSLWRAADAGRFGAGTLGDSDDLWRWLMKVTDSKVCDYGRAARALKRDVGRTRGEGSVWREAGGGATAGFDTLGGGELSPLQHAAFADTFEQFMAALPNDLTREVVTRRLELQTVAEIAAAVGVCQKTVKRKLRGARDLINCGVVELAPPRGASAARVG